MITMRRALAVCLLVVTVGFAGCARLAGPPDLPSAKLQVAAYMEGDGYQRDLRRSLRPVLRGLAALPAGGSAKLALVLDIDETALSTYEYQKGMGFGHYSPAWYEWQRQHRAVAILPVLEAYRAAQAKGVALFFVTGRREASRADTEANLRAAGYDGWGELMMKPDSHKEPSVAPFKTACREQIEERGYRILFNLGDQDSDLQGGHAERTVKLPNPIYRAP
jgi:acid phosphatase